MGARELTGEYGYCPHNGEDGIGENASDANSVTDFVGVGGMVFVKWPESIRPSESTSNSANGNGLRRTREVSPPVGVELVFDMGVELLFAEGVSGRKSFAPCA